MYRIVVTDLDTGDILVDAEQEHVEITHANGFTRLDPDLSGPDVPQFVDAGAATLMVKSWSGEELGMMSYEDFVNFTDSTGDEPGPGWSS